MKLKCTSSAVLAVIACLSGCAVLFPQPANPKIQYNYSVDNAQPNGIVQVFDLGVNTVVQIKDVDHRKPVFIDNANKEISFTIIGQSAVLDGIHKSFHLITSTATSSIVRNDARIAQASANPVDDTQQASQALIAQHEKDSPEALRMEIARMKKELGELRSLIAATSPREPAAETPADPRFDNAAADHNEKSAITVLFDNNSTVFAPQKAIRATLIDLAKEASAISVTGFTDSFTASPVAAQIAKLRAFAAKAFLVTNGIDARKISVTYQPAGNFVDDNKTKAGKAKNRRVEINMG